MKKLILFSTAVLGMTMVGGVGASADQQMAASQNSAAKVENSDLILVRTTFCSSNSEGKQQIVNRYQWLKGDYKVGNAVSAPTYAGYTPSAKAASVSPQKDMAFTYLQDEEFVGERYAVDFTVDEDKPGRTNVDQSKVTDKLIGDDSGRIKGEGQRVTGNDSDQKPDTGTSIEKPKDEDINPADDGKIKDDTSVSGSGKTENQPTTDKRDEGTITDQPNTSDQGTETKEIDAKDESTATDISKSKDTGVGDGEIKTTDEGTGSSEIGVNDKGIGEDLVTASDQGTGDNLVSVSDENVGTDKVTTVDTGVGDDMILSGKTDVETQADSTKNQGNQTGSNPIQITTPTVNHYQIIGKSFGNVLFEYPTSLSSEDINALARNGLNYYGYVYQGGMVQGDRLFMNFIPAKVPVKVQAVNKHGKKIKRLTFYVDYGTTISKSTLNLKGYKIAGKLTPVRVSTTDPIDLTVKYNKQRSSKIHRVVKKAKLTKNRMVRKANRHRDTKKAKKVVKKAITKGRVIKKH
ncbi:hypothetical protein [Lentilactobacillus sp. Marseille-Q4993]|uniref:hypothetical protein n=1 Tax=Lentilactobacillus sp. Marseille-Q4993 TaxID=3039492 RepID=UPI0024BC28EF|nr:hypothetical protein [Lentilactobacillus sp. Marseille-Q4993]